MCPRTSQQKTDPLPFNGANSFKRQGSKQGFTLIEVLLAVSISAIIMVAVFSMFDATASVAESVKEREETVYEARGLQLILSDDLGSLYSGSHSDFKFSGKSGTFLGIDGRLMEFCTASSLDPFNGPRFSLQMVSYFVEDIDEGLALYREERPYAGLNGEWEPVKVALIRGIKEIEVEYRDPFDGLYVTEWDGTDGHYPTVVRISYLDKDGTENRFDIPVSTFTTEKLEKNN